MARIGEGGSKVHGKKASFVLFTDGKLLLIMKRGKNGDHADTWSLPGGKSKNGETEIGTAVRETREETGLNHLPGQRIDAHSKRNGHQKITTYLYRVTEPFEIRLSDEHTSYDWVPFDELCGFDLHPRFRETLPEYLYLIRKKITSFNEWCQITDILCNTKQ